MVLVHILTIHCWSNFLGLLRRTKVLLGWTSRSPIVDYWFTKVERLLLLLENRNFLLKMAVQSISSSRSRCGPLLRSLLWWLSRSWFRNLHCRTHHWRTSWLLVLAVATYFWRKLRLIVLFEYERKVRIGRWWIIVVFQVVLTFVIRLVYCFF